jgi:hypothetical protein
MKISSQFIRVTRGGGCFPVQNRFQFRVTHPNPKLETRD